MEDNSFAACVTNTKRGREKDQGALILFLNERGFEISLKITEVFETTMPLLCYLIFM